MDGRAAVQATIVSLFRDKWHVDVPSADTDLFQTRMLDSLYFVELILHLEREFGIAVSFEDIELEHFRSIANIVEFVTKDAAMRRGDGGSRGTSRDESLAQAAGRPIPTPQPS